MGSLEPAGPPLDIQVNLATNLSPVPRPGTTDFYALGHTDHIISARWTSAKGWETPNLEPYGNLSIAPTASCLHYATECFEGMKCYRGYDGKLRLFRPDCNGERLAMSAARGSLPLFPPGDLKHLVAKLLEIDGHRWLPKDLPGNYLYIRPAMIGLGMKLGYRLPDEALLFIVATPYKDLSQSPEGKQLSLKLQCSPPDAVRAWPGGFGYAKLGANYGPSLEAHRNAVAAGFDQILWLYGEERWITEAGASNLFLIWKNRDTGKIELVTPSLQNKMILSGITRRSILEIVRSRFTKPIGDLEAMDVVERDINMSDVQAAHNEGRLLEAFVAGTAYFLTSVSLIAAEDQVIKIPVRQDKGGYYHCLKTWMEDITYGREDNEWAYEIEG
ncbi:branched-chain amino acid aminotransferase [Colletotrichum costaricense]|uniref:Branched-chain-amino-acid aminotransferase n=1 Tax=Colletotrichum costaricense TaxID=1209916 RepID=A0AAJ0DVJ4_9PEZI|nr:branched-chain amino acid aminotransferase [Colletotrichum costaricense]KAK1515345.1 branched-chain amino acid aminotransferase [Colletotrichum costaricense]